jgi:signal transduction histidine kinase
MSCIINFLLRHRSIALFRAVQDSLSNIIRHTQATHVRITIRTEVEMLLV